MHISMSLRVVFTPNTDKPVVQMQGYGYECTVDVRGSCHSTPNLRNPIHHVETSLNFVFSMYKRDITWVQHESADLDPPNWLVR